MPTGHLVDGYLFTREKKHSGRKCKICQRMIPGKESCFVNAQTHSAICRDCIGRAGTKVKTGSKPEVKVLRGNPIRLRSPITITKKDGYLLFEAVVETQYSYNSICISKCFAQDTNNQFVYCKKVSICPENEKMKLKILFEGAKNLDKETGVCFVVYFLAPQNIKHRVSCKMVGNQVTVEEQQSGFDAQDVAIYEKTLRKIGKHSSNTIKESKGNKSKEKSKTASAAQSNEKTKRVETKVPAPTLNEYANAVFREMYYLKEEGGRKYKVQNGKYITAKNNMYFYYFELESELFLADDSPISLSFGTETISGFIFSSDGFEVNVALEKNIGHSVPTAYISVEPWKLLQKLAEKLRKINKQNKIANELLKQGPRLAYESPLTKIKTGQETALKMAKENPVTVVWGPPGTGKTYTMAKLVTHYVKKGNQKVLIVAHSNIAVDNIIKNVDSQMRECGEDSLLSKGFVLRYGYVRDNELQKNNDVVSFNYVIKMNEALHKRYLDLLDELDMIKAKLSHFQTQTDKIKKMEIENEVKAIRSTVKKLECSAVSNAYVVGTTISKVIMDPIFDGEMYDVVIFDEVSMAYVPQILCAAAITKKHLVCVGDFRQLAPIVQSDAKVLLEKDLFTFLNISTTTSKINNHPWLVMLNQQRRMHPRISEFSNLWVYNGLLLDYGELSKMRHEIVSSEPFQNKAMNLINLSGTYCAASKNSDNSRFNIVSALVSFATAKETYESQSKFEPNEEARVGIITPYAAQTRLIRAILQDENMKSISCATVHQFQGSERNAIVFDAVESYPATRPGWLMSKNENNSVTRLINVAITRARGKFIVVANKSFWSNRLKGTRNLFFLLMKHLDNSCNVVETYNGQLKEYLEKCRFGKTITAYYCWYSTMEFNSYCSLVADDLEKAKHKVVISLPGSVMNLKTSEILLENIIKLQKKGIQVLCKAKEYEKLPSEWKNLATQSEDAVFPLIIIDDSVMWYGFPLPEDPFMDGNDGYVTSAHVCFKIIGKHTIEMVKSLADVENFLNGDVHEKLKSKYGKSGSDDDTGKVGLACYVEKFIKCPKCREYLKLYRGKSGKYCLKCAKCNEYSLLDVQIVNNYLTYDNVKCSVCGSPLEARVGQFGVFTRCDSGHITKLNDL